MTKERTRMQKRMAIVAAAAAVAITAGALLVVGTRATGSTPDGELAQMSNDGQPVDLGPGQRQELENVGATRASLLAVRDNRAFYRLLREDGTVCYAVNSTNEPDHVGNTVCPLTPLSFPTPTQPVLDLSIFESTSHVIGDVHVVAAQGFAADGVATVALLDRDGRVIARGRPVGNVYAVDVATGRLATTVVAYDRRKAEVFRVP
jgi:hypothetical protein